MHVVMIPDLLRYQRLRITYRTVTGRWSGAAFVKIAAAAFTSGNNENFNICLTTNNSNNVFSSENVNRTTIVSSYTMSASNEKLTKRRYCLWTLTFVLAILGLCNLFLNITVIAVLRISQGMEAMEVIPDENLVKFYGKTDLDRVRH